MTVGKIVFACNDLSQLTDHFGEYLIGMEVLNKLRNSD